MGDVEMSKVEEYDEEDDDDYVPDSSSNRVVGGEEAGAASGSSSDDDPSSEEEDEAPKTLKPKSVRIQRQSAPSTQSQEKELDSGDAPPQQRLSEFDAAQLAIKNSKKRVELSAQEKKDLVANTMDEMAVAYAKDLDNRHLKRPAMEKLKHLDSVLESLNNKELATTFMEAGVSMRLVEWLKPSRKYLPNARIRTELIKVCDHLPSPRQGELTESKLGKMLNYYATHDDLFENRTLAARIVKRWMDFLKKE